MIVIVEVVMGEVVVLVVVVLVVNFIYSTAMKQEQNIFR